MTYLKIHNIFKGYYWIYILIAISGCSVKKDTMTSRMYHNLTTHYNVFWNGRESYRSALADIDKNKKENYNKILPVTYYGSKDDIKKVMSSLDRAIDKCSKAIPKHSMRFKGKEVNRWIDDCYLLMGKASFYKQDYPTAKKTFEFIIQKFPGTSTEYEALLWLAKTYLMQGYYDDAYTQLDQLESRMEKGKVPYRLKRDIPLVYADYYLIQNSPGTARQFVEKGIEMNTKARLKTRLNFILAQIAQADKDYAKANEYYKLVLKGPSSYEMEFNARINMAKSFDFATGDWTSLNKQLLKMARETKNKEYLDQIYYALAELAKAEKNDTLRENYLKKSVSTSVNNNYQKSTSSMQLADWYFQQRNFPKALQYYDTTMQFLPTDYPDYYTISSKLQTLSDLVKNLETIRKEDSLQTLAKLPKPELDKRIAKIIAEYQKEQQRIKDEEQSKAFEQQIAANTPYMQNENLGSISGGGWYFYNTSAISLGYSEFVRRWGQRKLEDNWRLSDKRAVTSTDEIAPELAETKDSVSSGPVKKAVINPVDPKTYLADIPFSEKQLNESNNKIELALISNGFIYKSGLNDIPRSLASFEELIRRFPNDPEIVKIYYQLYLENKEIEDDEKADFYKNLIFSKFPDSDYALMIKDPAYAAEVLAKQNRIESLYSETYRAFNREQYRTVLLYSNEAISKYKNEDLIPKFEYLKALSLGKTKNQDGMIETLNIIITKYPKSPIAPLAKEILDLYKKPEQKDIAQGQPQADSKNPENIGQMQVRNNPVFKLPDDLPVITDSSGYTLDVNVSHFMVLMLDKNNVNASAIRTRLSDFISKNNPANNYSINLIDLGDKWQMLTVSTFPNLNNGMEFYSALTNDNYVLGSVPENYYRLFMISTDNYPKFFRSKQYEEYYNVFRRLYLKK